MLVIRIINLLHAFYFRLHLQDEDEDTVTSIVKNLLADMRGEYCVAMVTKTNKISKGKARDTEDNLLESKRNSKSEKQ